MLKGHPMLFLPEINCQSSTQPGGASFNAFFNVLMFNQQFLHLVEYLFTTLIVFSFARTLCFKTERVTVL